MNKHVFHTLIILLSICTQCVNAQSFFPTIQMGHTDDITSMQYVLNSESLLTTGMDEKMVEWDRETTAQVGTSFGLTGGASCFNYNVEDSISAYGMYNGQVQIYYEGDGNYEANEVFDFSLYVTSIAISKKGRKVAAASADFSMVVYENGSFRRLVTEGDIVGLNFSSDGRYIYFGNYSGAIYKLDTEVKDLRKGLQKIYQSESNISDVALSDDERYLVYGAAGLNGKGGELGVVSLRDNKLKNKIYDYTPYLGFKVNTLAFFDKKRVCYKNNDQGISIWNFKSNKSEVLLDEEIDVGFALSGDKKWCAYSIGSTAFQFRTSNTKENIQFKSEAEDPVKFIACYNNQIVVEYPSGIRLWNLEELKTDWVKEKFYDHDWSHLAYNHDLSLAGFGNRFSKTNTEKWLDYFYASDIEHSRFGYISSDNQYYVYFDKKGGLSVKYIGNGEHAYWGGKRLIGWEYGKNTNDKIDEVIMHPTKNVVAVLHSGFDLFNIETQATREMNNSVRDVKKNLPGLFDPFQDKLLIATSSERYDSFAYEGRKGFAKEWESYERPLIGVAKKRYLNKKTGVINIYELDSLTAPFYLIRGDIVGKNADVTAMELDSVNKRILIGYSDGTLKRLNTTDSGYFLHDHVKFSSGVKDIVLSEESKFIHVLTNYGAIGVLDSNLKYLVSLVAGNDNECIAIDLDGNYKRSKNAQNTVIYQLDTNVMRVNQIDRVLNKPHLVMSKLGLVNEDKLNMIERLSDKSSGTEDFKVGPILSIYDEDNISFATSKSFIKIKTLAEAKDGKLSHMKVWLNGVPVYSDMDLPKAKNPSRWLQTWKLPLKRGENSIRFVCYDEFGMGSNERYLTITSVKHYVKPDLYLAVVSVSEYQDATMNLNYAVKDGKDFANVYIDSFGGKQIGFPSRFGKVQIDTFFNNQAIKENIVSWRKKLLKSKPEDYVILYVSGHGLLDDSFNFWFATHDIDFDAPEKRGMSFDNLENLIVAIPAQQKLFLMDACHSGEVIEDELTFDSTFVLPDGSKGELKGYKYKGVEVVDVDGETIDRGELKQELFSNYNSKSGATVISAASGNSFALESDDWSNGIFTYTLVGGLVRRWADANNDGDVSVVELSRYVTKQVKKQTDGLQVPNDRQENIENNFRVW